jgi:hypothetical protein
MAASCLRILMAASSMRTRLRSAMLRDSWARLKEARYSVRRER